MISMPSLLPNFSPFFTLVLVWQQYNIGLFTIYCLLFIKMTILHLLRWRGSSLYLYISSFRNSGLFLFFSSSFFFSVYEIYCQIPKGALLNTILAYFYSVCTSIPSEEPPYPSFAELYSFAFRLVISSYTCLGVNQHRMPNTALCSHPAHICHLRPIQESPSINLPWHIWVRFLSSYCVFLGLILNYFFNFSFIF